MPNGLQLSPPHYFKIGDAVQAVDPDTQIWEAAVILKFPDPWSLEVRFVNWSKLRGARKVIKIAERSSLAFWDVRRVVQKSSICASRSLQMACGCPVKDLGYKRELRQIGDQVSFIGNGAENVDQVPNLQQLKDIIKERLPIQKGYVCQNDPFKQAMILSVDEGTRKVFVGYEQIRPTTADEDKTVFKPVSYNIEEDVEEDVEESPAELEPEPKRRKEKITHGERSVELRQAISQLLTSSECDKKVHLAAVPCINGIAQKDDVVIENGEKWELKKLYYDCNKKKPFAKLTKLVDSDYTLKMPAFYLCLENEKFCQNSTIEINQDQLPADTAFRLFSGIRHAVGVSYGKSVSNVEICEATEFAQKILGFRLSSSAKYSVNHCYIFTIFHLVYLLVVD